MQETIADDRVSPARDRRRASVLHTSSLTLTLGFHDDIDAIAPFWDEIAATGARASVFQSHGWLSAWAQTAAAVSGEQPLVVTARCAGGRLRMLLPLGLMRTAGVTIAGFLGQSHANYGLALVEPQLSACLIRSDIRRLFREIARVSAIDAVILDRQPATWNGRPSPFAAAGGLISANDSHVLRLRMPFEGLYAERFSARTRSTLRRKARRLAELGSYRLSEARDGAQRLAWTELFLDSKSRQLRDGGIADIFADPALRAFYRHLAARPDGSRPRLSISAIEAGGSVGALILAIDDGDCRYLLNTALAAGSLREYSPGLLLLTDDIATAAAARIAHYDFGPGAAAYKAAWAPDVIPLVTTVIPVSAAGLPFAAWTTATALAKRTIKRNPSLWSLTRQARRHLFGARMRADDGT